VDERSELLSLDIGLMAFAAVVAAIALLASPLLRAICWDSFKHPRFHCVWVRNKHGVRELKNGIDE
jgi:hypothetical protein